MRCSVLCRQERTDSVYYQEAEPAGVQLQSGVMAVLILVMHNAALMHPSLLLCTSAAVDAHAQEQPAGAVYSSLTSCATSRLKVAPDLSVYLWPELCKVY